MSGDIPVGQWESLLGGPDKRTDEEIAFCSSTFNKLPSSNERISVEAVQNSGEEAQGILLEIHDRLGQISAISGRGVQQHAALNDRDQSFHDVDLQGESNAPDFLLSGIRGEEDVVAGVREGSVQETTRIERAL